VRPKLLDLFCGVGGAAMGYYKAGFDILGVDIEPQLRYPFDFVQADAMDFPLDGFDAIHASPPCQAYADEAHRYRIERAYPDLVRPVRDRLLASGKLWVIENVDTAPLRNPMMLCGTMFDGVRVIRHRMFESNIYMEAPGHPPGPHPRCFSYDKRRADYGQLDEWTAYVTITGGGNCGVAAARDAIGIRWATMRELKEAIPPAYTEYVGRLLMAVIRPGEGVSSATSGSASGTVRQDALSA
jgi:DNA (cytosine-5)-methyltransferase 1